MCSSDLSSPLPIQFKVSMEALEIRSLVQVLQSTDLDLDDDFLQLVKKTCVSGEDHSRTVSGHRSHGR